MKLVIGSAQMGMRYGLFNKKKISKVDIDKITRIAHAAKIDLIDTASVYGDSEKIIGKSKLNKLKIITKFKFPKIKNIKPEYWVKREISKSLRNLKVKKIYAILVHDHKDLMGKIGEEYLNSLKNLKKKGIVKKIGVSIYDTSELEKIWKFWKPDIVQAPFNPLDNRLVKSRWAYILKKNKVKIYARSIFLQGLLINDFNKFIKNNNLSKFLINFNNWCLNKNISRIQACLHYIKQFKEIDYAIVGFDNSDQLKEIVKLYKNKRIKIPKKFITNNEKLIDPRKWNFKVK
jgi:aryl-alcohol dehydrogenase-like predicted oxidoreductase